MPAHRLRTTLHHAAPKPAPRPAPLWQAAASLDPAARQRENTTAPTPPPYPRHLAESADKFSSRQTAILHARDAEDLKRVVLVAVVVCTGVLVAGAALWQAHHSQTVYVPVPSEPAAPPTVRVFAPAMPATAPVSAPTVYLAPTLSNDPVNENPRGYAPRVATTPAMPLTWTPPPAYPAPTPVDYAARDRQVAKLKSQIEEIDETIRGVRADPHWYGMVKGSTDTSRQQSSDGYLNELDRRRNDLRRQKWALEGR